MFRLAFLLNPPVPLVKGGIKEGLKYYQNTYGRNEQCRSVSVPPFSKGPSGFSVGSRGQIKTSKVKQDDRSESLFIAESTGCSA